MLALCGCQTLGYYGQALSGEVRVLRAREPIDALRRNPRTDAALAARLATADSILSFAGSKLALPAEGRYRTFADVGREPIVWNVFAASEFSVDPREWCYPIVGCAAYRGYFHRDAAVRESVRRQRAGDDVRVSPVAAYSTLGWFRDPLLSSFIYWPDADLARLLVHELAHVEVFVKGDTDFNESYASFVERAGVREWISAHGTQQDLAKWQDEIAREDRFAEFMLHWRAALAQLYARPYSDFARRVLKAELLASAARCYRDARAMLGERAEMSVALNNADFVPWAAYERWVPAFAVLFRDVSDDWPAFHRRVAELGRLDASARHATLGALAARADQNAAARPQIGCESLDQSADSPDDADSGRQNGASDD